jgi:hypothetical protein
MVAIMNRAQLLERVARAYLSAKLALQQLDHQLGLRWSVMAVATSMRILIRVTLSVPSTVVAVV